MLSRKQRYILYALAIAGLLLHMVGTYLASVEYGAIVKLYKGYLNVPCILYSIGVFVLLQQVTPRLMCVTALAKTIHFLKPYTFAIYLLQPFFLILCTRVFNTESMVYRLGGIVLIAAMCVVTSKIIRKFPYGTRILP